MEQKERTLRRNTVIGLVLLTLFFTLSAVWVGNSAWAGETVTVKSVDYAERVYSDILFSPLHIVLLVLLIVAAIASGVLAIWEGCAWDGNFSGPLYILYEKPEDATDADTTVKPFRFGKVILWTCIIVFGIFVYRLSVGVGSDMVKMYNTSKRCENGYKQKVQEKAGFYDKMWKTYLQKEKITNVNRETFIYVTQVIMENRADGEKLTWKWLQENQPIPYDEFTVFYKDLSAFITSQREAYFNIERECQIIAQANNTLLDTFPNNIYNKVLKLEHIDFDYGMLSDSTNYIFKSRKENIK